MASQPSFKPLTRNDFFADGRAARQLPEGTIARGYLRTDAAQFTGRKALPSNENAANDRTNAENSNAGKSDANTSDVNKSDTDKSDTDKSNTVKSNPDTTEGDSTAGKTAAQSGAKSKHGFENDADFVDTFPFPIDEKTIEHGYHRFMIYCVVCHDPIGTGRGKVVERGYTPPPSYHIDRLRKAPVGRLFAVVSEGYGSMPSYAEQIPVRDRWAIIAYVRALQLSQHFPEDQLTNEMRQALKAAEQDATPGQNAQRPPEGGSP